MSKNWEEGTCKECGLNQNCLIEDMEKLYSFWKCIYCENIHTIKWQDVANEGGEE